jgi:hypothetical protein
MVTVVAIRAVPDYEPAEKIVVYLFALAIEVGQLTN